MTTSTSSQPQNEAARPAPQRGPRLLPLLALMLGLVISIRVGDMWQDVTLGIGGELQAQEGQPQEGQPQEGQAQEENTAGNGTVPAPAEAVPGETQEAATDGGEPTAEAGAAPAAPTPDPLDFTDEEVEVLLQLAKRREELEVRARQLDEREAIVAAAEQRMEQKMAELRALQTIVEDLLAKRSEQEEATLQTLVQTYEKMKPKDAAQVFEEMDMDLLKDLVSRMKTSRAAPILALVSPTKVKELTLELAEKDTLPFAP